jgi:hypothetical protein
VARSGESSSLARVIVTKGVRMAVLAAETGLSLNATRRIVRGEQEPSIVHALLIAESVEDEVESLFAPLGRTGEGRKYVDDSRSAGRPGRRRMPRL